MSDFKQLSRLQEKGQLPGGTPADIGHGQEEGEKWQTSPTLNRRAGRPSSRLKKKDSARIGVLD